MLHTNAIFSILEFLVTLFTGINIVSLFPYSFFFGSSRHYRRKLKVYSESWEVWSQKSVLFITNIDFKIWLSARPYLTTSSPSIGRFGELIRIKWPSLSNSISAYKITQKTWIARYTCDFYFNDLFMTWPWHWPYYVYDRYSCSTFLRHIGVYHHFGELELSAARPEGPKWENGVFLPSTWPLPTWRVISILEPVLLAAPTSPQLPYVVYTLQGHRRLIYGYGKVKMIRNWSHNGTSP